VPAAVKNPRRAGLILPRQSPSSLWPATRKLRAVTSGAAADISAVCISTTSLHAIAARHRAS
jgi:hypothetical protein